MVLVFVFCLLGCVLSLFFLMSVHNWHSHVIRLINWTTFFIQRKSFQDIDFIYQRRITTKFYLVVSRSRIKSTKPIGSKKKKNRIDEIIHLKEERKKSNRSKAFLINFELLSKSNKSKTIILPWHKHTSIICHSFDRGGRWSMCAESHKHLKK